MSTPVSVESIVRFLSKTALFSRCSPEELQALADGSQQAMHEKGDLILKSGVVATHLGLIMEGRAGLVLVDAASARNTPVETLRQGDLYGELGFLMGSASPLTVVAQKDCRTLEVGRDQMVPLFKKNAHFGLILAKLVAARFLRVCLLGSAVPEAGPRPSEPEPAPVEPLAADSIVWVDVGRFNITPEILALIPSPIITSHRVLPLELQGKTLLVGMVNPRSAAAQSEIRRVLHSVDPKVVAISLDDFNQTFVRLKLDRGAARGPKIEEARLARLVYAAAKERVGDKGTLIIGDEVIALFDRILAEALARGASDIHVEPDSTGVRVRYRVGGTLLDREEFLPQTYAQPLIARIKVLAELDITEHRLPQDGRISAQLGRRELNLRVSTMAVARGEKAVIRIIDPMDVMRPLHQIFLDPDLAGRVNNVLGEPSGAIVVAGPTGSGKSSTLYSMLNTRQTIRPDHSIVTVEDPVEFLLPKATQVGINARVGMTFPTVLRGLMRQDPDVIMIGELRDADCAAIMAEAALTGHLVLSSMHGNNAASVLQRLLHFGLNPVLLSQALSLVVAQRLVGRLCPSCVAERDVAPALVASLVARQVLPREGAARLPSPVGCDACGQSGYLGRVAVQELLHLDDTLRGVLASGASPAELLVQAQKRGRFTPFARSAAYLINRRVLAPSDALLLVSE